MLTPWMDGRFTAFRYGRGQRNKAYIARLSTMLCTHCKSAQNDGGEVLIVLSQYRCADCVSGCNFRAALKRKILSIRKSCTTVH